MTAFQERLVPLLVVPDAARPAGALGFVVQLLPDVVTLIDELWAPAPAASDAATVNVYVVDAVNPVTLNDVPVAVPIDVPAL